MKTVTFGTGGRRITGDHAVKFKRLWTDQWVTYPDAHCLEAVWTCAPTIPAARIVWDYGHFKSHISPAFARYQKLDISRWYVKVTFTTDVRFDDEVVWYGVVSDIQDDQAGLVTWNGTTYATGTQTLYCYGLEQLLNQSEITSSFCYQGVAELHESPLPIDFNERGYGNRTATPHPAKGAFVFDGTPEAPSNTTRKFWDDWTTRDIVEYLLHYKGPTKSTNGYQPMIPFRLAERERLDNTDSPVLSQEGATPLALLNRLIDRRRMQSFYFTVDETNTPAQVNLTPFSFAPDPIEFDVTGIRDIPGNTSQKNLIYEMDELTSVSVRDVDLQLSDRVVVRGARRTTTCSMFYTAYRFEPAWTSTQETAYEAGATGEAGYGTWDTMKQMTRNQEVRGSEALRPVYSWFRIPSDWDGLVGYHDSPTLTYPAFIDAAWLQVDQYVHGIEILPYLPLYEGVDYSGTAIATGANEPRDRVYRRPFVTIKRPTDGRYMLGEKMGQLAEGECDPVTDGNNPRWSCHTRPQPHSRIVEVNVSGEPQHVIAKTDFSAAASDRDVGDYDYKDKGLFVTMALAECRYAEAEYPDGGADSPLIDAQRTMVIWAGDEYRHDYVVAGTILDVDTDGTPKEPWHGGYVRDDTDRLYAMAKTAYWWYHYHRAVLSLTTYRLTDELAVGDMITSIGLDLGGYGHLREINSPITQIRFQIPRTQPGTMQAPTMQVVTTAGELDVMTLVPPPPRRRSRGAVPA